MPQLEHPRSAAGLSFSPRCAVYYWLGVSAWVVSSCALLYAELHLRLGGRPGWYLGEGLAGLLIIPLALVLADQQSFTTYRRIWRELRVQHFAPLLLEPNRTQSVRAELNRSLLLRWLAPPPSRNMAQQLLVASQWYSALIRPDGTGFWVRYQEWLVDALAGFLPQAVGCLVFMLLPSAAGLITAAVLVSGGQAVLGYSAIRFAARRQAVLDFFKAWDAGQVHH